jgi:hypothetical protein
MVEEVDVSAGQLESLYLGELVRGEGGHDLPQLGEGLVQALRPLPLSNIRCNNYMVMVNKISVADLEVYPGSGIFCPGSRVKKETGPGSRIRISNTELPNLSIFNLGNMIRDVYPGSGFSIQNTCTSL